MFGWNRKCVTLPFYRTSVPSEGKLGEFSQSQNEALAFLKSQHQVSADDFLLPMTTNKVNFDSFQISTNTCQIKSRPFQQLSVKTLSVPLASSPLPHK